MAGFSSHRGTCAIYLQDHVDTDRIVPARFLSRVSRLGYGEELFRDVRTEGFPLDRPEAKGASVLVVGCNFGCGSSREHAVWAIQQAGFVAVIARVEENNPGFSDIFRQNAANCGLLLVELEPGPHQELTVQGTGSVVEIDLPGQTVSWDGGSASFEIAPGLKAQIMAGHDLIGSTLVHNDAIGSFEQAHESFLAAAPGPATP
jgi:3-isopropylmalate/(R)-2-methylmalate dehydratase small subunit